MNNYIETPSIGEIKFFGVSDRYFLQLQDDIDVRNAKITLASEIASIQTLRPHEAGERISRYSFSRSSPKKNNATHPGPV